MMHLNHDHILRKRYYDDDDDLINSKYSASGEIYTWGSCSESIDDYFDTPRLMIELLRKDIIQVCCGYSHTFALSKSGALYSWGYAKHGVLGIHSNSSFLSSPIQIITPPRLLFLFLSFFIIVIFDINQLID